MAGKGPHTLNVPYAKFATIRDKIDRQSFEDDWGTIVHIPEDGADPTETMTISGISGKVIAVNLIDISHLVGFQVEIGQPPAPTAAASQAAAAKGQMLNLSSDKFVQVAALIQQNKWAEEFGVTVTVPTDADGPDAVATIDGQFKGSIKMVMADIAKAIGVAVAFGPPAPRHVVGEVLNVPSSKFDQLRQMTDADGARMTTVWLLDFGVTVHIPKTVVVGSFVSIEGLKGSQGLVMKAMGTTLGMTVAYGQPSSNITFNLNIRARHYKTAADFADQLKKDYGVEVMVPSAADADAADPPKISIRAPSRNLAESVVDVLRKEMKIPIGFEGTPPAEGIKYIQIFQDGENCWFGSTPGLDGAKIFTETRDAVLSTLGFHKDQFRAVATAGSVAWKLFLPPLKSSNKWLPTSDSGGALDQLQTQGVELNTVTTKKGDVDIKMKAAMSSWIDTKVRDGADLAKYLVVVATGDCDFAHEMKTIRDRGCRTMLLHGGRIRRGFDINADFKCDQWLSIIDSAGNKIPPDSHSKSPNLLRDARSKSPNPRRNSSPIGRGGRTAELLHAHIQTLKPKQLKAVNIVQFYQMFPFAEQNVHKEAIGKKPDRGLKNFVQRNSALLRWIDADCPGDLAVGIRRTDQCDSGTNSASMPEDMPRAGTRHIDGFYPVIKHIEQYGKESIRERFTEASLRLRKDDDGKYRLQVEADPAHIEDVVATVNDLIDHLAQNRVFRIAIAVPDSMSLKPWKTDIRIRKVMQANKVTVYPEKSIRQETFHGTASESIKELVDKKKLPMDAVTSIVMVYETIDGLEAVTQHLQGCEEVTIMNSSRNEYVTWYAKLGSFKTKCEDTFGTKVTVLKSSSTPGAKASGPGTRAQVLSLKQGGSGGLGKLFGSAGTTIKRLQSQHRVKIDVPKIAGGHVKLSKQPGAKFDALENCRKDIADVMGIPVTFVGNGGAKAKRASADAGTGAATWPQIEIAGAPGNVLQTLAALELQTKVLKTSEELPPEKQSNWLVKELLRANVEYMLSQEGDLAWPIIIRLTADGEKFNKETTVSQKTKLEVAIITANVPEAAVQHGKMVGKLMEVVATWTKKKIDVQATTANEFCHDQQREHFESENGLAHVFAKSKGEGLVTLLKIPHGKLGRIIGKDGSTIQGLKDAHHVKIITPSRDASPDEPLKVFAISKHPASNPEACAHAIAGLLKVDISTLLDSSSTAEASSFVIMWGTKEAVAAAEVIIADMDKGNITHSAVIKWSGQKLDGIISPQQKGQIAQHLKGAMAGSVTITHLCAAKCFATLRGPEDGLSLYLHTARLIEQQLQGNVTSETILLKPVEYRFLTQKDPKGNSALTWSKNKMRKANHLLIWRQDDGKRTPVQEVTPGADAMLSAEMVLVAMGTNVAAPCTIEVHRGSILDPTLDVDAIVNAANKELHHVGGIARVIANAAGAAVMDNAGRYALAQWSVSQGGTTPFGAGCALMTSSCNLGPKPSHIIHAVAPNYLSGSTGRADQFRGAVLKALEVATLHGLASVAIPLIGSGVYGWQDDTAAGLLVDAINIWVTCHAGASSVNRIVLVDVGAEKVLAITNAIEQASSGGSGNVAAAQPAAIAVQQHQWYWRGDSSNWVPYDPDQNQQLETAYLEKQTNPAIDEVGIMGDKDGKFSDSKHVPAGKKGAVYSVYLNTMQQVNSVSGFQRKLKRSYTPSSTLPAFVPVGGPVVAAASNSASSMTVTFRCPDSRGAAGRPISSASLDWMSDASPASDPRAQQSGVAGSPSITIMSMLPESVATAKKELEDWVNQNWQTSAPIAPKHALNAGVPFQYVLDFLKQDEDVKKAGPEIVDVDTTAKTFKIRILGNLDKAQSTVLAAVYKAMGDFIEERDSHPSYWDPDQPDNVHTVIVPPGSPEYREVCNRFETDFTCTIVKVLRVQNKELWKEYIDRRAKTAKTNGNEANEIVNLKHGTGQTDPTVVYTGAHGIDFRYCRGGFYGKGIYLAEDAEYSHSYTHTTSDNNYQMFMARAAVGKVEQRDKPDQNIVHPKPGHHSIRGPVRGIHQAYICYESYMAYPEYLITYSK